MNTPICDFVRRYAQMTPVRMHMPGHKGTPILGFEQYDITEIDGADELFASHGIIAESEENASAVFGVRTLYSAAGSTLCIQAMLWLIAQYAVQRNKKPLVLAARNAHRAFVNAAALTGMAVEWIFPRGGSYHSCDFGLDELEKLILAHRPVAVYLTSPDYLGNIADIESISKICRKHSVVLAVDNAHGAYLRFLPKSMHPSDLGADICCDSAHKTLPVITGGAYLHIGSDAPKNFAQNAKIAMSVFGSSSPSYLILQSLDAANARMTEYKSALEKALPLFADIRQSIERHGIETVGNEPLKLTVAPKSFGYDGIETARFLKQNGIYVEYYDLDYTVLMLSPFHTEDAVRSAQVLCSMRRAEPKSYSTMPLCTPRAALPIRDAMLAESEVLPIEQCVGRVCAVSVISCPPAIPIVVCGEIIDNIAVDCLKYYGIDKCAVLTKNKLWG